MTAPRIMVIGLGNPDRGDDGVGLAVAAAVRKTLPPTVRVIERRSDMLALMDDWAGADALVCVDAAAPMGEPGRIHRIDLTVDSLPPTPSAASSHALGLADAIALARILGTAPRDVIAFAIEGQDFNPGAPISAAVAVAIAPTASLVMAEVSRLQSIALGVSDA